MAPNEYLKDPTIVELATPENFAANAVPATLKEMDFEQYSQFLTERRKLMAAKMKLLYYSFTL